MHYYLKLFGKTKAITAQKMKFSIKGFFSKYDQIRRKLQIWSHLMKKSLMENFVFCAVNAEMKPCLNELSCAAQNMKFSITNFISKCEKTHRKLRICSHLLSKSLTKAFIFLCSGSELESKKWHQS